MRIGQSEKLEERAFLKEYASFVLEAHGHYPLRKHPASNARRRLRYFER
jgi:hypothetical protein